MRLFLYTQITFYICAITWVAWAYTIYNTVGDAAICTITKVDDGDTFDLACWDVDYPNVRLIWVNAPDIDLSIQKKYCYYDEAKKFLERRVWRTYKVFFYGSDLCKDPYKWCRNLVQLTDIEGRYDIWRNMILKWVAMSWTNFSVIPEDIRTLYDLSELDSRRHRRWLWEKCQVQFGDDSQIDISTPDKMTL